MSITIHKAGVCDTIQDMGRKGYASFGINPSGAMDTLSMQVANALVKNSLNTEVIEMHFPASVFYCIKPALIALSGADFDARIQTTDGNIIPLPTNKSALLPAGSKLFFNKKVWGERCYLAVLGGFNLPLWFGSYSTNLKIKHGGYHGRKLATGDQLNLNTGLSLLQLIPIIFPWTANFLSWYADAAAFNIIPGPECEWLEPASKKHFLHNDFVIAAASDRMGIVLEGVPLHIGNPEQLVSSGVNYGTIQLLPGGKMIILAADHPTTGGYPRIANVITAHLPKLSQATPGTRIRFLQTDLYHAEDLVVMMQKELMQLKQAVRFKLEGII